MRNLFLHCTKTVAASLLLVTTSTQAGVVDVIRMQTPVKAQGGVGACSIFSATGLLEFKLIQAGVADRSVNLSEQWLLYITAAQKGEVGVTSTANIKALNQYGFVEESDWKFSPIPWDDIGLLSFNSMMKCGHLKGTEYLNGCLIGRRDPRLLHTSDEDLTSNGSGMYDMKFYKIRKAAQESLQTFEINGVRLDANKVMKRLDQNEPVLLDVNFYYQAWNHRRSGELGLERDMDLWHKGIVSYPDRNSLDAISKPEAGRPGHSVIVVGYDKNVVIERTVADRNGNPIRIKTKGVYYFKNSWGTDSFGKDFSINGENFPGYGMISMQYAHEYGRFVAMTLNGR